MSVALKAYLNNMGEHEKNSYAQLIISTEPRRLKEIKNLDPGFWKTAQEIPNARLEEDRPRFAD